MQYRRYFLSVKKPLKRLSSQNRITTQAKKKNRWKLTKFLVTLIGLAKINKLQSTDILVKCHTISNVTKWLDWIISRWRDFMGGYIVLDTNIWKNVYRFILQEKSLNSENFCIIRIFRRFVLLELFHLSNKNIVCRTLYL